MLIQDYHLCLAPRLLRDRLGDRLGGDARDAGIGHFCHTPWAPPDYYRMLPDEVGRALLDGILGADRAGFHAERWATAFMDCCAAVLGAQVSRTGLDGPGPGPVGRVTYRGHVTEVAVHPLGVDAPALRERARAGDVRAHVGALRRAAGDRKLIVRVDRTELSKNIVRGLAAYRELLATRPQWRGRVVHLAFAYPSRSALAEYRAYTDQVRELARQITEEFRTADWDPLILEVKDDYPRSLAACALADVLLVNPIRDGMNLVAQEGPVLSERGCALVLSREAGAAATLAADALLVNPYDVTETAEALHRALTMPDAERQPPQRRARRHRRRGPARPLAGRPARLARARALRGAGGPDRSAHLVSWPASAVSSATTPSGPATTRSAAAATCGDSALALATAQPGTPSARSERTAANAGRSPRSSPQNRTERAARSPASPVSALPLSTPGGRSSITKRPGSAARPSRAASSPSGSRSRSSAARGSAVPRVCTATACALSSTQVPSGACAARSTPGSAARARSTAGGGGAVVSSPSCQRCQP